MYRLDEERNMAKIEPITFSEMNWIEEDMEELLRNNIDMICDEEESMLIVGRQVTNAEKGRSDLTAIDNNGNIVLIEIKRDRQDIERRKEAFEFQAIRYAASYAMIEDIEDLVNKIYAPYIDKYRDEFEMNELTAPEIGTRKLIEFLEANDAEATFNQKQRIILVASEFDKQTLSAVAWLNSNRVDISCYKLIPYQMDERTYLSIEKVLPVMEYEDYYVDILHGKEKTVTEKQRGTIKRRSMPKIKDMLNWGVVQPGDELGVRGREETAILLQSGNVDVNGEEKSLQAWLQEILGWSSVQTYEFTTLKKENDKLLADIRREYMEQHEETSLG